MRIRGGTMIATLVLAAVLAPASLAVAQGGPVISTQWQSTGQGGGALNVSVSGLPPGAPVEVEVRDISHGNQVEQPVGSPPAQADANGNWPGAASGSQTGYPETAQDAGGTRYVVSVKVNGRTGPAKEIEKPGGTRGFWSILSTLGGILLTDALGVTSGAERPLVLAGCPV
ncbi:MAG: hypothetical protein JXQ29_01990 [Planctomycetes bacterium]|nr:hypothetical protein [Planctomycetota bacterium]